jgi:hypothetical protein
MCHVLGEPIWRRRLDHLTIANDIGHPNAWKYKINTMN